MKKQPTPKREDGFLLSPGILELRAYEIDGGEELEVWSFVGNTKPELVHRLGPATWDGLKRFARTLETK